MGDAIRRALRLVATSFGQFRATTRSAFRWLRHAVRRESRRRRVAWAAVAVLLIVAPVAFDLGRASRFSASVIIYPRQVAPYPPIRDPRYYQAFLLDPELRLQMRLNVGKGVAKYRDVTIDPLRSGANLLVTARADTPAHARDVVNALASQIAGASRRELTRRARADALRLRSVLRSRRLPGGGRRLRRSELRRTRTGLRVVRRVALATQERIVVGARAGLPKVRRWPDRVTEAMPGDFPARPPVAWVAVAGLLIFATLWGVAYALVPPVRAGSAASGDAG